MGGNKENPTPRYLREPHHKHETVSRFPSPLLCLVCGGIGLSILENLGLVATFFNPAEHHGQPREDTPHHHHVRNKEWSIPSAAAGASRRPRIIPERHRQQLERRQSGMNTTRQDMAAPFAACLYIGKDDSDDLLSEWLAYHYYMLPLRHLRVMIDPQHGEGQPSSSNLPEEVLERWRPFIDIEMGSTAAGSLFYPHSKSNSQDINTNGGNSWRQLEIKGEFFRSCAQHFQKKLRVSFGSESSRWVSFHDVSDFLYLDSAAVPDAVKRMRKPGSIATFLYDLMISMRQDSPRPIPKRTKIAKDTNVSMPRSLLDYGAKIFGRSCLLAASTAFVSIVESTATVADPIQHVPPYLNTSAFVTTTAASLGKDKEWGKSLVQIRTDAPLEFVKAGHGVHRILNSCPFTYHKFSPIRIKRYESPVVHNATASGRGAAAATTTQPGRRNSNDGIGRWLQGFSELLDQDQGLVEHLLLGKELPSGHVNAVKGGDHHIRDYTGLQHHNDEEAEGEAFASCLLIMDENHRLPEWLAFHYYMLPLRHAIILVDPRSQTSPAEIVERWQPFINIQIWSDADIGFRHAASEQNETNNNNTSHKNGFIRAHLKRQGVFYRHCANHFRKQQQEATGQQYQASWVTFHDIDEYLYLEPNWVPDAQERMSKSGSILQFIRDLKNMVHVRTNKSYSKVEQASLSPISGSSRSRDQALVRYGSAAFDSSCLLVARTYFGAVDQANGDAIQRSVPGYLNASHFDTLRYLHRTAHGDYANNGLGKSIIQVSSLSEQTAMGASFYHSIHRVLKTCPTNPHPEQGSPIRIRHYLGSWEAYANRVQPKVGDWRTREMYEYRSQLGGGGGDNFFGKAMRDDNVRMWMSGFCKQMNHNQTLIQHLLQGAGQVENKSDKNSNSSRWHLTPFQIKDEIDRMFNVEKEPGNFAHWLQQQFNITTLANGTIVATRRHEQNP